MKVQITELCLTVEDDLAPFAVLVEHEHECAWAMASDLHPNDKGWLGHVLEGAERRPEEWWVLEAWRDWLKDVAGGAPDDRREAFRRLGRSTPGCIVRRSRTAATRLPAGAVASRWRRDRLFDRAELIAAEIAARLAEGGKAFWNATLTIGDHEVLTGDWVVEVSPAPGFGRAAPPAPGADPGFLAPDVTVAARGLALVHVVKAHQVAETREAWSATQRRLGPTYPYAVTVVRDWHGAEVMDGGCLIGERFAAPVSLGVAAVRSKWYGP